MKKVKLTPEQKAYIKGLEKSKHRKAQKLQFRLQNAFEQTQIISSTEDKLKMVMTFSPFCNSTLIHKVDMEYFEIKKKHNK